VTAAAIVAVGVGAALGAWLRWVLAAALNPVWVLFPLGTLTANLAGGYLIGVAIEVFGRHAGLAPEVRLFVITGFLGALTTFSTFSAEVVDLLARSHYGWAAALAVSHLAGSLVATVLGMLTVRAFG